MFLGASLSLGIILGSQLSFLVDALLFLLVFGIIAGVIAYQKRVSSWLFFVFTQVFFILFGIFIFQSVNPNIQSKWFDSYDHENFKATVLLNEVGNTDKELVKCRGEVQKIVVGDSSIHRTLEILFFVESGTDFLQKGDEILVSGKIEEIKNKGNPGEFDAESYWKNKGVNHVMFVGLEDYKMLDHHGVGMLEQFTDAVFSYCSTFFKQHFAPEQGAVLSAIVLGDKSSLDSETMNSFLNTGTMHVLAVSGMHFGLLMLMMMAIFERMSKYISRRNALIFMLVFFWFYALLTGMSASVVRSIFMFSLLVLAQMSNRQYDSLNVLFFSAFILLLLDPLQLFDVGFQLSYLAMIGIFLFYPSIRGFITIKNTKLQKVWEGTAVGLAAQIMTIPISLHYFHSFPNYFLLSNWVLMLTSNFILGFGVGILLLSKLPFVYKPIAFLLGWIVAISLTALSFIEQLPGAVAYGFSLHFVQVLFLVGISFYLLYERSRNRKILIGLPIFLLSLALISIQRFHRMEKSEICIFNTNSTVFAVKVRKELYCFYDARAAKKMDRVKMLIRDYQKVNPATLHFMPIDHNFSISLGEKKFKITQKKYFLLLENASKKIALIQRYRSVNVSGVSSIGYLGSLNCNYYLENGAKVLPLD